MTRQGVPYTGGQLAFYDEAMRAVPAIAKARAQGRSNDVRASLSALSRTGYELGIEPLTRWSILCSAYMAWAQQLFEAVAAERDEEVEDVLDRAIGAAAVWVAQ